MIVPLYVEPDSTHGWIHFGLFLDVMMESSEYSSTSPFWWDIHTLYPPEHAIPPVTPFIGDHELPYHLCTMGVSMFRDDIEPVSGRGDQRSNSLSEPDDIEITLLCFLGHGCIERNNGVDVIALGLSDYNVLRCLDHRECDGDGFIQSSLGL
jgi:hypothetical protein